MGLSRQLVAEIRRLNDSQLRQLLILARGLLLDAEVPVVEISDIPGMPAVRYRQRSVSCGKASCGACPHGPYWYAHWTEDGRKRSQYIGSELPTAVRRKLEALDAVGAAAPAEAPADRGAAVEADPAAEPPRAATAGGHDGLRRSARLRLVQRE